MYVHPQIDYNIETLFKLIDTSGLEFLGFLIQPTGRRIDFRQRPSLNRTCRTFERARSVPLIELLDPEVTHYEFSSDALPYPKLTGHRMRFCNSAVILHGWMA